MTLCSKIGVQFSIDATTKNDEFARFCVMLEVYGVRMHAYTASAHTCDLFVNRCQHIQLNALQVTISEPTRDLEYMTEGGYAPIDPGKLKSFLSSKGMSQEELGRLINCSRGVINRMITKKRTLPIHLVNAAKALGTSPVALQPSSDYHEPDEPTWEIPPPRGWKVIGFIRRFTKAANGLAYCVAQLENEHIPQKFSRGKFYQLSDVQSINREEFVYRLVRHPTICTMLRDSDLIVKCLDVRPFTNNSAWWVLDEWIDGQSLDELMDEEVVISRENTEWIASSILDGLTDLHRADVIFRELAPERVYVLPKQSKVTLTDFELARLGEGMPSVSGDWKTPNPYRAPEIGTYDPTVKVDIFSWAAIVIEMLCGDPLANQKQLSEYVHDEATVKLLLQCRSAKPSARPESISEVQNLWTNRKVSNR